MASFNEGANIARDAARRGDLTLSEQLGLARGAFAQQDLNQILQGSMGLATGQMPTIQAGTSVAQGLGQGAAYYQQNRNLSLQAAIANAQNNPLNAVLGGVGTLAGTVGGIYGANMLRGFL
jgi:hypothetical protein